MTSYIFEIYKNHVEYREREFSNYKSGMTIGVDEAPELLMRFDTLEKAKDEFSDTYYTSDVSHMQYSPFALVHITEYVLWKYEVDIDEEGDIDYIQGEVLDVSDIK